MAGAGRSATVSTRPVAIIRGFQERTFGVQGQLVFHVMFSGSRETHTATSRLSVVRAVATSPIFDTVGNAPGDALDLVDIRRRRTGSP